MMVQLGASGGAPFTVPIKAEVLAQRKWENAPHSPIVNLKPSIEGRLGRGYPYPAAVEMVVGIFLLVG